MGSENALWQTFKRNMSVFGRFDRHEDKLSLGVPDISYCIFNGASKGWIELKYVEAPPKRASTIFRIDHFTREQKAWLRGRGESGDNCWVFLQMGREYYLFDWASAQLINTLPWFETREYACRGWYDGMNWPSLAQLL